LPGGVLAQLGIRGNHSSECMTSHPFKHNQAYVSLHPPGRDLELFRGLASEYGITLIDDGSQAWIHHPSFNGTGDPAATARTLLATINQAVQPILGKPLALFCEHHLTVDDTGMRQFLSIRLETALHIDATPCLRVTDPDGTVK